MPSAVTVFNLVRAEWLKLYRRPLALGLLALFLTLLFVQMALQFMVVGLAQGLIGGIELTMFPEPQLANYRAGLALPGAFGTAFGHANGLGGIFAMILTAGAMGSEYSWGTLRMQLTRQPSRPALLAAKALALLALLGLALLLTLVLATLLSLLFGSVLGLPMQLDAGALLMVPLAWLRALYVWLPYVLLTLAFSIWGRSALSGIAGGLLYLVFEVSLGGLTISQMLSGIWGTLYNLTIGQNINALAAANNRAFGLDPEAGSGLNLASLPSTPQAALVIALYCILFFWFAIYLLQQRDVQGPN